MFSQIESWAFVFKLYLCTHTCRVVSASSIFSWGSIWNRTTWLLLVARRKKSAIEKVGHSYKMDFRNLIQYFIHVTHLFVLFNMLETSKYYKTCHDPLSIQINRTFYRLSYTLSQCYPPIYIIILMFDFVFISVM